MIEVSKYVGRVISLSGMSQKEVAEKIGVSGGYLSDMVRGRRAIPVPVAMKLEKVVGVNADLINTALMRLPPPRKGEELAEYAARVDAAIYLAWPYIARTAEV